MLEIDSILQFMKLISNDSDFWIVIFESLFVKVDIDDSLEIIK